MVIIVVVIIILKDFDFGAAFNAVLLHHSLLASDCTD